MKACDPSFLPSSSNSKEILGPADARMKAHEEEETGVREGKGVSAMASSQGGETGSGLLCRLIKETHKDVRRSNSLGIVEEGSYPGSDLVISNR